MDIKKTKAFIRRNAVSLAAVVAVILFAVSFAVSPESMNFSHATRRVEKNLRVREALLDKYVEKVSKTPANEWFSFDDFPDDMVLYRYNYDPFYGDTLQCWMNRFPISNDEINTPPVEYRLNYLSSDNLYATPLAYVNGREQYVNLGSAWYLVKMRTYGDSRILTGLLVKSERLDENSSLTDRTNPKLKLDRHITTCELGSTEGVAVKDGDGDALFKITPAGSRHKFYSLFILRWIAYQIGRAHV